MFEFRSALFQGDALLQRIADDLPENGRRTRISRTQHRKDPAVRKVQQALLDWKPGILPRFGADGDYGNETAAAVKRFKMEVLGSKSDVIDDVGPLTTRTLDGIRAAVETPPIPPETAVRVRADIWDLGDAANPWRDPRILAYALAINAMQDLDSNEPDNGTSWINQAAIHQRQPGTPLNSSKLQDECQHFCWFFLPWHRIYLFWFEEILRSHMDPEMAATWALPYWNYSDVAARRVLPPAFRQTNLPQSAGGGPNPLFISRRQVRPININGGQPLRSATVDLQGALQPAVFSLPVSPSGVQGFGGGDFGSRNHDLDGPSGPLENAPHGSVHVEVGGPGGFMTGFGTAALDPIFWLHHCNIDRLWEVWRRQSNRGHGPGSNPTQGRWLTEDFEFFDAAGGRVTRRAEDVLDIEGQLGYTYSNLPAQRATARESDVELRPASVSDQQPPEMIGASEETTTLTGQTQRTRLPLSAPLRPASSEAGREEPEHVYLTIDNIEGDTNPGLVYGVFVNLPDDQAPEHPSPYFAGTVSFFGIENSASGADDGGEKAPHKLSYGFDITPIVTTLKDEGRWDPDQLQVTFTALAAPDEELAKMDVPAVHIGRVSLYVE